MNRELNGYTVANVLGAILLIVIVIPFIIFAVPGVVGAEGSHVVLSGSMQPAISPGDVVIVNDVDTATIEQGDIITFSTSDENIPTTHRVIEVLDQGEQLQFRTKGDANEDPDATPVPASNMQGRVMFTIPFIGHVIAFASEPLGAVLLMGVPLGLLVLSEIWSFAFGGTASQRTWRDRLGLQSEPTPVDDGETNEATAGGGGEIRPRETVAATSSQASVTDEEDTYTVSRTDIQLTLLVTGVFAAYAGWIFYQRWIVLGQRTPVPISVAFATTASFLLLLAIYYGSGSEEAQSDQPGGEPLGTRADDHAVETSSAVSGDGQARVTGMGPDQDRVPVRSVVQLIDEAVSSRTPIRWEPWHGTFRLPREGETVIYSSAEETLGVHGGGDEKGASGDQTPPGESDANEAQTGKPGEPGKKLASGEDEDSVGDRDSSRSSPAAEASGGSEND